MDTRSPVLFIISRCACEDECFYGCVWETETINHSLDVLEMTFYVFDEWWCMHTIFLSFQSVSDKFICRLDMGLGSPWERLCLCFYIFLAKKLVEIFLNGFLIEWFWKIHIEKWKIGWKWCEENRKREIFL